MSEERWAEGWDESSGEDDVASRPDPTGVPRVDAVLDEVSRLDDQPLSEHVSVFERAHDELRRTLDELPADAPPVD